MIVLLYMWQKKSPKYLS